MPIYVRYVLTCMLLCPLIKGNSASFPNGLFNKQFEAIYGQWLGGLHPEITNITILSCAVQCVDLQNCVAFQYMSTGSCISLGFIWEQNTTILKEELEDGNCFVYTGGETDDYIYHRSLNLSFKYYNLKLTRQMASNKCTADGALLFSASTEVKDNFLYNAKLSTKVFLGLTDYEHEGIWQWENGNVFSFHNFFKWPQSNHDSQHPDEESDCVAYGTKWDAVYCGRHHKFFCEKQP